MDIDDPHPNKSDWPSRKHDRDSVRLLQNLWKDCPVDDSHIEIGGTTPNIDGYIDILDAGAEITATITLQVKHLTYPPQEEVVFYDIPQEIVGYAKRIKTEVVLLVVCDTNNGTFYWKYIDENYIKDFCNASDHLQKKVRYYFKPCEYADGTNIHEVIAQWKRLYDAKKDSIVDRKLEAERLCVVQKKAFGTVKTNFGVIADTHIHREVTETLFNWIIQDGRDKTALLIGDAGAGKSVVIKDLIDRLDENGIKCLCIKADYLMNDDPLQTLSRELLFDSLSILSKGQDIFVLVIDQIDALSQYMTKDRKQINNLLSTIASVKDFSNIRVVISCRKYDAKFDPALRQLESTKVFTIGSLSDSETRSVVDKLEPDLWNRLDPQTRMLIHNAQLLNVFCQIYKPRRRVVQYSNSIALYDDLWAYYCGNTPQGLTGMEVEGMLFKLAEIIRDAESLAPIWTPSADEKTTVDYLASNGAIMYEDHHISFFHQSFYEYVLARYYTTSSQSFISDIEGKAQGLELRATVKLVLDYERGHNERVYIDDVTMLLTSDNIRQHIKLLVVSSLAALPNPQPVEKRIVKNIIARNEKHLSFFLKGLYEEQWFTTVVSLLKDRMPSLTTESVLFSSISRCLCVYSFAHSTKVFDLLGYIKDDVTRQAMASFIMSGNNNYTNAQVCQWYRALAGESVLSRLEMIRSALESNITFALNEAKDALTRILLYDVNQHDIYFFSEYIVKSLTDTHPVDLMVLLDDCFAKVFEEKTVQIQGLGYGTNKIIKSYLPQHIEELWDSYRQLLIKYVGESDTVTHIVRRLLDYRDEMSLSLAFEVMSKCPQVFYQDIKDIVSSDEAIDNNLHGNFEYYFLEMLKAWYLTLGKEESQWFQDRLLNYKSSTDNLRGERIPNYPILWHWGIHKWMLICVTIPSGSLCPALKRCKQELLRRRAEKEYINKPSVEAVMASVCGGLTSDERYRTFSKRTWLNSFLKLTENGYTHSGKSRFLDLNIHAAAFSKCVAGNPQYFKPFVFELFERTDIRQKYKLAGLSGLIDAGTMLSELWPLVEKLDTSKTWGAYSYQYSEILRHFITSDALFIEPLLQLLLPVVKKPYKSAISIEAKTDLTLNGKATDMMSRAINSPAGHALGLIISMSEHVMLQNKIYNILTDLFPDLHPDLRLMTIHYLFVKERYDEDLFERLYIKYLSGLGAEAIAASPHALQIFLYHKTEKVTTFLDRIENDPLSHELLAQIYFYGSSSVTASHTECLRRLEIILSKDEENVIATVVECSLKSIAEPDYAQLSEIYVRRYATDGRSKVHESFIRHCDALPANQIHMFAEVTAGWSIDKYGDCYNVIKYLEKCSSDYPVECYEYIRDHNMFGMSEYGYTDREIINLLVTIYKRLKIDVDSDAMEKIMDLFDTYTYSMNTSMISALEIIEQ